MFTVSLLFRILEDYEKMIRDRAVEMSKDMLNSLYNADRLLSRRGILQMKVQSMLYELLMRIYYLDLMVNHRARRYEGQNWFLIPHPLNRNSQLTVRFGDFLMWDANEECWDACSAEEFFFRYQARAGLQ